MIAEMKVLDGAMHDMGINDESIVQVHFDVQEVSSFYVYNDCISINVRGLEYLVNYSENIEKALIKKFK